MRIESTTTLLWSTALCNRRYFGNNNNNVVTCNYRIENRAQWQCFFPPCETRVAYLLNQCVPCNYWSYNDEVRKDSLGRDHRWTPREKLNAQNLRIQMKKCFARMKFTEHEMGRQK